MDGSRPGCGFCRFSQPTGLEPVERKVAGGYSHSRRRSRTAFKRTPEERRRRTLYSHLLHLTGRGVERPCGARIDTTRLSQRLPPLRRNRRVATGRVPIGTKIMKKLLAIFTAAAVILVLSSSGCNHSE